jgi:hypothetical protein
MQRLVVPALLSGVLAGLSFVLSKNTWVAASTAEP